jgi:hypothetical protein
MTNTPCPVFAFAQIIPLKSRTDLRESIRILATETIRV